MVRITLLPRRQNQSRRCIPAFLITAALCIAFLPSLTFAQLSGSYTIGTGQTYTTVSAFVSALNTSGVSGPVTASVTPGTYTGAITINAISGASSTNTITIQGQNVNTCIVEAPTNGSNTFVVLLNGADYIRIRDLTINATGTTYGYGVWFQNQANYNEVTGCKINVSQTTTSSYCIGILASGSYYYSSANAANYTLIEDNEVKGGYYGILFRGASSTTNSTENEFVDNQVTDFYYYGVYSYYQSEVVIEGNTIVDRGATPYSYGVYLYYNRTGPQVNRNTIVAGTYGLYSYRANQDNSVYGEICNNMVTVRGSSTNYGLRVYYYNYKMRVDNNSINMLTNSTAYGLYYYYGSNGSFRNNVVQYKGTGTVYFVYVYSSYSVVPDMDYNVFWSPNNSSDVWRYNGYDYSLNDFKAAVSSQNNNSWMYDPEFIDDFNLHTYSQNLNNTGTALTHVTEDRDGDARNPTTPDIGADEYTLFAVDAGAKLIASPIEGCGLGAGEDLIVGIRNYGTTTLTGSSGIVVQVTVTGPINQNFSAAMTSGSIAPGATYNFTVSTSLDLSIPGEYIFNATASASGDGNAANNDMDPLNFFVDKTIASFPYFENFEAGNGSWRSVSLGGLDVWEWGDPSYSGTYSLNTANSGTNAWMTDLNSNYPDNHYAALMSPCFDMTTLSSPVFQFYSNYACEGYYDGWAVEASGNGGQTWTRLTPYNPPYNYTSVSGANPVGAPQYSSYTNNTWKKYVFLLGSFANNPNVKLRIPFGSDGSVNGYPGVAIDDPAVGDFYQKDIVVTDVVYDNATDYWARRQNANHVVHARIVNMGYEENPTSVSLTYKEGSAPGFDGDGVSQTFSPSWSGSEAWVTFSTQHMPASSGPMNLYVKAFYPGDQNASNDMAMTTPIIQPESVFGYEDFNSLTPPNWEKGWTVLNVNNDETWENTAAAGVGGTNAASYPGGAATADDWLFTPGAMLLAGSSYSVDFMYRSRNGQAQTLEVAYGPSPDPNSMTVFAVYNNFTNSGFTPSLGQYGVAPFFNTPNVAQLYYIGFHVKSAAGAGPLDIDDIMLYDNPFPPPKIAYGVFPIYIDDPTIPITFTGVYKKTGLLSKTFEVVNSTGWYGNPDGDMLWDVNTSAPWIDLYKSTPDPLAYLVTNPFNPPWARQNQTFTMEVNASILPPGKHISSIDLDAYLYNSTYTRGIRASNAIFSVPVELTLSQAGGSGTGMGQAEMTLNGLDGSSNPYEFRDDQGNLFARVWVTGGIIPSMTIHSYPGQLPVHLSKYRYVDHYWTIDAPAFGWTADIEFHYFDSEVASGGVMDEYMLRGMRIAPGTGFWEDPIMGTNSSPDGFYNYVFVQGFNPTNFAGEIAMAHDYFLDFPEKSGADVPSSFSLDQNFPNPFNPATDIRFGLPSDEHVTLTVMNAMGEEVARLVDAKQKAGYHSVNFNASNLPSGMYLYRITAGDFVQTRTMILNK